MGGASDNSPVSKDADPALGIARQLVGDLRCIRCGYNLRGLSIREMCPECGLPVRATLLGVVDPRAHELVPLAHPRVSAWGLVAWGVGAWAAVACVVILRVAEVGRESLSIGWKPAWAPGVGELGLLISALGGVTLIHPHHATTRVGRLLAAGGVAAYIPLVLLYRAIYTRMDAGWATPFLDPGPGQFERAALRLAMVVPVAAIVLGLRPHARMLSARSVIVRTGKVDRQSLLALLASFCVAGIGDAMQALGGLGSRALTDLLSTVGMVLIAVGSVLVVIGATNIVADIVRLFPVIARPGVGLEDVLEDNRSREQRAGV